MKIGLRASLRFIEMWLIQLASLLVAFLSALSEHTQWRIYITFTLLSRLAEDTV